MRVLKLYNICTIYTNCKHVYVFFVKSVYELCHVCKYFCLEEMCVIYISVVKVRLSRNECHELTIIYECNTMLMYECHMNTVIVRVTYKQKVRHFCCIFAWEIFLRTHFFCCLHY